MSVDGRSMEQLEHDQHHDDKPIDLCIRWECVDYVRRMAEADHETCDDPTCAHCAKPVTRGDIIDMLKATVVRAKERPARKRPYAREAKP